MIKIILLLLNRKLSIIIVVSNFCIPVWPFLICIILLQVTSHLFLLCITVWASYWFFSWNGIVDKLYYLLISFQNSKGSITWHLLWNESLHLIGLKTITINNRTQFKVGEHMCVKQRKKQQSLPPLSFSGERRGCSQKRKRRIRRGKGQPVQTRLVGVRDLGFIWKEDVWEVLARKSTISPCLRDQWDWKAGEQGLNAEVHRHAHKASANLWMRCVLSRDYTELIFPWVKDSDITSLKPQKKVL